MNPENFQDSSLKNWEFWVVSEMNESNLFLVCFERELKLLLYPGIFIQSDEKLVGKAQALPI